MMLAEVTENQILIFRIMYSTLVSGVSSCRWQSKSLTPKDMQDCLLYPVSESESIISYCDTTSVVVIWSRS